ncbi:UNVERIFIED_CONTAM: hypothetical protein NCL1_43164 [Trichonephila clavipes]
MDMKILKSKGPTWVISQDGHRPDEPGPRSYLSSTQKNTFLQEKSTMCLLVRGGNTTISLLNIITIQVRIIVYATFSSVQVIIIAIFVQPFVAFAGLNAATLETFLS